MSRWVEIGAVYEYSRYATGFFQGGLVIHKVANPKSGDEGLRAQAIPDNSGYMFVRVTFYLGLGWLSDRELFDLRQREPRMAP